MALGGLDIGTSSVKCVLYDEMGQELVSAVQSYKLYKDEGFEYNPEEIWNAVKKVISECGSVAEIEAIGISSMGESYVCLDENDQFLGRPMMYIDHRGVEECDELVTHIGKKNIRAVTGTNPSEQFSLVKMLWMKRHKSFFSKTRYALLFEDFIGYMLTGERQISESLATRTMGFDIRNKCWWDDIFEAAGINKKIMSRIAPAGSVIGKVRPTIADELNISRDMLVVNGGHDQFCAPVGCGVMDSSVASNGMGSSDAIHVLMKKPFSEDFANRYNYCEGPYLQKDLYYTFAGILSSGSMLRWYQENIKQTYQIQTGSETIDFYNYMEQVMGTSPSGIICIPAFSGMGDPVYKTNTSGLIYGLRLNTTEGQLYRSLLEGVAYGQLMNIEYLQTEGVTFDIVHATGGGALSPTWMQIRADIYNKKMCQVGKNACARAGAILCAVAVSKYRSVVEASENMIQITKTYYPDQTRRAVYMEGYEKYKDLLKHNY